jgi:hypothetical protein
MRLYPADKNASCEECQAIARELNAAHAESYLQNKAAKDVLDSLVGGTEEDAERAAEMVGAYRYNSSAGLQRLPNGLREASRRGAEHFIRTGHFLKHAAR